MKTYLLFVVIITIFSKANAQQSESNERFAFISIYFEDVYKIKIDSGQAAIAKKTPFVTDSAGNVLRFTSPAAALTFVGSKGWKFQAILFDIDESYSTTGRMYIQTGHGYLFKKDY